MTISRYACLALVGMALTGTAGSAFAAAADCPNSGTVRFGIEPYEAGATLVPIFEDVAKLIGKQLDCDVQVFVTTSYNAEIEAMRSGKLELGEYGRAGLCTRASDRQGRGGRDLHRPQRRARHLHRQHHHLARLGHHDSQGRCRPLVRLFRSGFDLGHLFPAFGLRKIGIDPDNGIKAVYAGSHTASYETIKNHKVDAGELNSR